MEYSCKRIQIIMEIQLQENTNYNGNTAARKYKLETERKMQNYTNIKEKQLKGRISEKQ